MPRGQVVSPEQMQQLRTLTVETFDFDWDSVVVPLVTGDGAVFVLPDGKLLLRPPPGKEFEPWFAGLEERLRAMDLRKVPRAR